MRISSIWINWNQLMLTLVMSAPFHRSFPSNNIFPLELQPIVSTSALDDDTMKTQHGNWLLQAVQRTLFQHKTNCVVFYVCNKSQARRSIVMWEICNTKQGNCWWDLALINWKAGLSNLIRPLRVVITMRDDSCCNWLFQRCSDVPRITFYL